MSLQQSNTSKSGSIAGNSSSSTAAAGTKKKGSRRKIPILALDRPLHESVQAQPPVSVPLPHIVTTTVHKPPFSTERHEALTTPKKEATSKEPEKNLVESTDSLPIAKGDLKKIDEALPEEDYANDLDFDWDSKEESIKRRMEISKDKMKNVLQDMDEEQMKRYETFRRSGIQRPTLKKWIQSYIGQAVHPNIAIVVAGVAKVFVGELVEEACEVQLEWKDPGALLPSHVWEAYRRLTQKTGTLSLNHFVYHAKKRHV